MELSADVDFASENVVLDKEGANADTPVAASAISVVARKNFIFDSVAIDLVGRVRYLTMNRICLDGLFDDEANRSLFSFRVCVSCQPKFASVNANLGTSKISNQDLEELGHRKCRCH